MPSLGADMEAGTLREWRVKPGDYVHRGDIIAEVETQKGIVEIEIFDEGKIEQLLIQVDEKVPVGTPMAMISGAEEKVTPEELKKIKEVTRPPVRRVKASPLAKKIAAEYHIDLSSVAGSGAEGAITREDVEKLIKEESKSAAPAGNMRQAIAAAMSRSNKEIPHYYLETDIDMSYSLKWLREENKKRTVKNRLLPPVLLIKAIAKALKVVPGLNGSWENGLIVKEDIHIGFVVSLRSGGIIIPTIHHADRNTIDETMELLNDLIPRAKALRLKSSELADSTITVSSLGENSVEKVFGVIYPPQVALIGLGNITEKPWAENGMLGIRPVLTATLSGDHRATDGQTGSRFLMSLKNFLQKPEAL